MTMNYPSARCEVSKMSFRLGRNLSSLSYVVLYKALPEGFPTSGNDKIREILTPKLSFEEFFDYYENANKESVLF